MGVSGSGRHLQRERGRPREFDIDQALDRAMLVFRQQGFHATSMADLAAAMNLTAGSIYKAFKDKRTLFMQVFERYTSLRNRELRQRLALGTTGREQLIELLRFYLDSARAAEGRHGCLVVSGSVDLLVLDASLSALVREAILGNRALLVTLVQQGQRDGSVAKKLDADVAADLLLCMILGMRVAGKVADISDGEATLRLALKLLD